MRAPFVPAGTVRGQVSPVLSGLPPPGTAAAQTGNGHWFLISKLAALVEVQKMVMKTENERKRFVKALILRVRYYVRYSAVTVKDLASPIT